MSLERRQNTRVTVSIAVEVRDARGFSLFSTRDLSIGGLFFDRAIPYAVGTRVQLAFTLPGELTAIRCDGEVVNVPDTTGYGMGVRFLGLGPQDVERIEQFLRSLEEDA